MYVTLKELAAEFGLDRSNVRKYVLQAGFSPLKVRTSESRGQLTLALSEEDAEAVRELRQRQGFTSHRPVDNGEGQFYIIQLVPDLDTSRVKLGFASNVDARLQAHRTAAPTAELVKAWPCKRSWERAAMDCMTQSGCTLIANEVFMCDDIETMIKYGDSFFGIMPDF
jgi:hypothetical protein